MRYILLNNIKQYRKIYNVTQEELGNAIGLSRNAISNIENYVHGISSYHAFMIAKFFNVSFHDIFVLDILHEDGIESIKVIEDDGTN